MEERRGASARPKHQARYLCFTSDERRPPRPHPVSKITLYPEHFIATSLLINTFPVVPAHDKQIQANMNIQQARQPDPSFARTTALMVNIFSMTTEAVDPHKLLSEREVRGQLHLRFRPKWDISPGILAREGKSVTDESFKAFKSHNYCVFACRLLAGLLAWLVEGEWYFDCLQEILTANKP